MVNILVNRFAILSQVKMFTSRHGCSHTFAFLHVELLEKVLSILCLRNKGTFLSLLDLQTKKEFEFTHHRHLKLLRHSPSKLFTKMRVSRTKYDIININLAH